MNKNNQKGFTLIEVLVAIAILSFGLIAMNFMQTQSVRGNAGARALTERVWLASDAIEGFLIKDYNDISNMDDSDRGSNSGWDGIDDGLGNSVSRPDGCCDGDKDGKKCENLANSYDEDICVNVPEGYTIRWNVAKGKPEPSDHGDMTINAVPESNVITIRVGVRHEPTGKELVYDYYKTNLL